MGIGNDKKVVLAVDDVAVNLQIIRNLLSKDFDVRVAKSGELALSILGKLSVDLVLMDIEMPDMSGFECVEKARLNGTLGSASVIYVTSHSNDDIPASARDIDGAEFVSKPINEQMLAEAIVRALKLTPDEAQLISFRQK